MSIFASFENEDLPRQYKPRSSAQAEGTTIADLPDKCLISIFNWIPLPNLDSIIELCPHWDKLVQENIPLEIHLTDIGFRIGMHFFIGHDDLPKYRVKIAHSRVLDEKLPELKAPEDLQVVKFSTATSPFTYLSFLSKSLNLQELHFDFALSQHLLSHLEISLPKLTLLSITDREILAKLPNGSSDSNLSSNVTGFLEKSFPSIEEINVNMSALRRQTTEYVQGLIQFITNHSETLKRVKLNVTKPIHIMDKGTDSEGHNEGVENAFFTLERKFDMDKLSLVKLEELELNFGGKFFVALDQWTHILNHQKHLSHLNIGMDKPLNPLIYVAPVTDSAASLVSLQLGVEVFDENQNQRVPLDCSIFEACQNLKMLVMKGPTRMGADRSPPISELLNVSKLPISLTRMAIENIYLETKQVSEVTRGLFEKGQRLERISLRNIGTEGKFGVKISMLDNWISGQVFQEIIVKGVNEEGESQLTNYKQLNQFGLKSPINQCLFHAYYFPKLKEYRKPNK